MDFLSQINISAKFFGKNQSDRHRESHTHSQNQIHSRGWAVRVLLKPPRSQNSMENTPQNPWDVPKKGLKAVGLFPASSSSCPRLKTNPKFPFFKEFKKEFTSQEFTFLAGGAFLTSIKFLPAQGNALLLFLRHKVDFISFLKKLKIQKVQKLLFSLRVAA